MSTECFVAAWGLIFSTFLIKGGAVTYVTHEVLEGHPVEFSCNLTYDPSENFRWIIKKGTSSLGILVRPAGSPPEDAYRPNSPLQNRTDIRLSGADGTNLTIESVRRTDEAIGEDYYECQQRMGDKDTVRHQLIVQYPPDPPTNLTLTTTSAGLKAICVAGKSKTGSQMICLEYQQHEASKWNKEEPCQPAIRDGRAVQFEVRGLQSMQSYNVCCIASDAYGATATCQNTGPLTMTMTGASLPGWAIAIICVGVLLIVVFSIIVYCCRKHGKEGNACRNLKLPWPFGKRGRGDVARQGNFKENSLVEDCCNCFRTNQYVNHHHYHSSGSIARSGHSRPRVERSNSEHPTENLLLPASDGAPRLNSFHPPTEKQTGGRVTVPKKGANTDPEEVSVAQDDMWDAVFQHLRDSLPSLSSCQHLFSALGLSAREISTCVENCPNNVNQFLHIIWFWHQKDPDSSPLTLAKALDECGCHDVAEKVQTCWREHTLATT